MQNPQTGHGQKPIQHAHHAVSLTPSPRFTVCFPGEAFGHRLGTSSPRGAGGEQWVRRDSPKNINKEQLARIEASLAASLMDSIAGFEGASP